MNEALAIVTPAAVVLIWLIRLEGRVNTNEALQKQIANDVSYLRERIDKALNGHD